MKYLRIIKGPGYENSPRERSILYRERDLINTRTKHHDIRITLQIHRGTNNEITTGK